METPTNTSPQSNQSDVGSAETQTATQQVETLGADAAWYIRWKDRADVLSIALAALVFMVAFFGNRLGAKMNRANRELAAAKERLNKLQVEKVRSDTERQVSEINKEAAKAIERAGEANEQAAKANERTINLELEAAKQVERAAKAEQALEEVRKRQDWRRLPADVFITALKERQDPGYPGEAIIMYPPDDLEAYAFALQIKQAMTAGAGWNMLEEPRPISTNRENAPLFMGHLPPLAWYGAGAGITILLSNTPVPEMRVKALVAAFTEAGYAPTMSGYPATVGTILIIVGPKP